MRKLKQIRKAFSLPVFLLCAAMLLCTVFCTGSPSAAADAPYYHFQTMSELRELISRGEKELWAIDDGGADHVIDQDLTIPKGNRVFFGKGKVTVSSGATVTIQKGASLFFRSMDLEGRILNRGELNQNEVKEGEDAQINISGSLVNSGWFTYYRASGLEHLQNSGYAIDETETTPAPKSEPEPTPAPASKSAERSGTLNLDQLRRMIRLQILKLRSFFLRNRETLIRRSPAVLALIIALFLIPNARRRSEKAARKQERSTAQRPTETKRTAGTGSLTEEQRKRIARLDDWLKSGLIDREEYKKLKERYRNGR